MKLILRTTITSTIFLSASTFALDEYLLNSLSKEDLTQKRCDKSKTGHHVLCADRETVKVGRQMRKAERKKKIMSRLYRIDEITPSGNGFLLPDSIYCFSFSSCWKLMPVKLD